MLNTISHQWGRDWVKWCCKKAPSISSPSQSLLPLSPNREAMAGASYLIPAQDLLEGMEREQLASGIRKKRHGYRQRTYPSPLSASKTGSVWVSACWSHWPTIEYKMPSYSQSLGKPDIQQFIAKDKGWNVTERLSVSRYRHILDWSLLNNVFYLWIYSFNRFKQIYGTQTNNRAMNGHICTSRCQ